jgi:hypothetical protein
MYTGVMYLGKESTDVIIITMAGGMKVTILIMTLGYAGVMFYGLFKKDNSLWSWVDRIGKEGLWKYTEDEKVYLDKENAEYKANLRKYFPFIKKFDKKVV